jgi:hypothetical protein
MVSTPHVNDSRSIGPILSGPASLDPKLSGRHRLPEYLGLELLIPEDPKGRGLGVIGAAATLHPWYIPNLADISRSVVLA